MFSPLCLPVPEYPGAGQDGPAGQQQVSGGGQQISGVVQPVARLQGRDSYWGDVKMQHNIALTDPVQPGLFYKQPRH